MGRGRTVGGGPVGGIARLVRGNLGYLHFDFWGHFPNCHKDSSESGFCISYGSHREPELVRWCLAKYIIVATTFVQQAKNPRKNSTTLLQQDNNGLLY
jgi:hypothetical protein